MIKIVFASGKSGAGKTSLSLSYHKYLKEISVYAECDVNSSEMFLPFEKKIITKEEKNHLPDLIISESIFNTKMVYAKLLPGMENSEKLINEVIKTAKVLASENKKKYLVIDYPSGVASFLIASITPIDILAVIIECTREGLNDAKKLIEIAGASKIRMVAVLNKTGLNTSIDDEVEVFLRNNKIQAVGKVPFNDELTGIYGRKQLLFDSDKIFSTLKTIFSKICKYSIEWSVSDENSNSNK